MLGAIAGDIIGSVYERSPIKTKSFPLFDPQCTFTDDSVLTIAVAVALLSKRSYQESLRMFGRRYPDAGYGDSFANWLHTENPRPYNSWGNGAAMRVSPIGHAFDTEDLVLAEAHASASITHNHPEGVKGAQAAALAVFMARTGFDKKAIRKKISALFAYDLNRTVDTIRPAYSFKVCCQRTVPEAIIAFLDSDSYEDTLRNAVSLGGDSDTLACIAGGIAEAFYGGIPDIIALKAQELLPGDLWHIVELFRQHCERKKG